MQSKKLSLENEPQGAILTIDQPNLIIIILNELKHANQTLKSTKKLLEHSYVLDSLKIKQQNELFGKSVQEAFKIEMSNALRGKSEIERLVDRAIESIQNVETQINKLNNQPK